jgi:hypothetical protein
MLSIALLEDDSRLESQTLIDKSGGYMTLARRLESCPPIQTYDHDDHKEAWVLAHSLMDLETSFRAYLDEDLPALLAADSTDAICGALIQIRDGLRHAFYHLHDPEFFEFDDLERKGKDGRA